MLPAASHLDRHSVQSGKEPTDDNGFTVSAGWRSLPALHFYRPNKHVNRSRLHCAGSKLGRGETRFTVTPLGLKTPPYHANASSAPRSPTVQARNGRIRLPAKGR